ncbi:MAG: DUF1573 domain-containing protein [Chloroflexi bacterium]|nr:MAG: DUF1573 domain-containing protein [Chloroflexota bacterium]
MKSRITIVVVSLGLLLAACAGSGAAQISLETEQFEFGDVVNGTLMTKDLTVSNVGTAPLLVEAVSTSCGCTTAALDPMTIAPGESATLHIEFDSGAHGPEYVGEFSRQIFIASNDEQTPEALIEFVANILPPESP